ncbi:MAG: hypothetical protein ACKPKO_21470, partial [Candidatus Fonsibacter sp.]
LTYQDPLVSNNKLFVATVPIIYKPEDNTTNVQLNPTGGQDLSGTYYHVHNYIHFIIIIINKAFDVALNNLRSYMPQNEEGATIIDYAVAPYLDFDLTTNRVILHAQQYYFDKARTAIHKKGNISILFETRDYTIYLLDFRTNTCHLMES